MEFTKKEFTLENGTLVKAEEFLFGNTKKWDIRTTDEYGNTEAFIWTPTETDGDQPTPSQSRLLKSIQPRLI